MTSLGTVKRIHADTLAELLAVLKLPDACNLSFDIDDYPEDWSVEPEVRFILNEICRLPSVHTVLEVGAYKGDTTMSMARTIASKPGATVYAVESDTLLAGQLSQRVSQLDLPVVVLPKTSASAFREWGRQSLDLVLVDASHEFTAAFADIASWSSLLAPDGWLVVHDTLTRLERRFPTDYLVAPFVHDVVDVVGLSQRMSSHAWEGFAVVRWCQAVRSLVKEKHLV